MNEIQRSKLNEKAKLLNKRLTKCRSVKRLLGKKAWKTIIQPLIDTMVSDVIGGKEGKFYSKNPLSKPKELHRIEYYIGYKQALMDLNNAVWNYPESIELLKKQIKNLEDKANKPNTYSEPMKESKYAE